MNENKNEDMVMGMALDDEQLNQIAGGFGIVDLLVQYLIKKSRELLNSDSQDKSGFGGAKRSW